MQTITLQARAKINLTLDVTGKLPNGYHTVKMVMQTISLHDDVTVTLNDSQQFVLQNSVRFLPTDDRNLAMRAAKKFYEVTGIPNRGTAIQIEKRIPVAAGLAGGSTDAAAVLMALDTLYETKLGTDRLCEMALPLGADVPYCIRGGTMLAEGIGEILTPLPAMPYCHVVLVKPPFSVSTAEIYAKMNGGHICPRPDTAGMCKALQNQDLDGICHRLYNVMESVTGAMHSDIAEIRDVLLSHGALGAIMSGSGPTVYGIFTDIAAAEHAAAQLQKIYKEVHLAEISG